MTQMQQAWTRLGPDAKSFCDQVPDDPVDGQSNLSRLVAGRMEHEPEASDVDTRKSDCIRTGTPPVENSGDGVGIIATGG